MEAKKKKADILRKPTGIKIRRNIITVKTSRENIPQYDALSESEQKYIREELTKRYMDMCNKHKLPCTTFAEDYPLDKLHRVCNDCVRQINIAKLADEYKMYYMGGFIAVFLAGKFTGKFDISTILKSQKEALPTYDQCFLALAESRMGDNAVPSPLYDLIKTIGISVGISLMAKAASLLNPTFGSFVESAVNGLTNINKTTVSPPPSPQENEIQLPTIPAPNMVGIATKLFNGAANFLT